MIAALNHISASCVVFSSEVSLPFKAPLPSTGIINEIVGNRTGEKCSTRVPSLNHILMIDNSKGVLDRDAFPGATWYGNAIAKYKSQTFVQDNSLRPTDVINIQFTSGTTSSPKAACLSHINILNNAHLVGKSMELSQEDVICCAPPLFHCFGIVLGVLAAMTHGE
jgi:acyl-CoA synthetase (AMP-forming)/AMP-acid ligase II